MMLGQAALHQGFIFRREAWLIEVQGATNQQLPSATVSEGSSARTPLKLMAES